MNPKNLIKLAIFTIIYTMVMSPSYAQDADQQKMLDQDRIEPKVSEVWYPQPKKVVPGIGTAPPSDAIVLFDGSNFDEWTGEEGEVTWKLENGMMTVAPKTGGIKTKRSFGDVQLHIEWKTPTITEGPDGQDKGNSGIFMLGLYEIQVLDSHGGTTYANGQAGSIYKQSIPLVNATLPAEEWNVYDIIFQAPLFKEDGSLGRKAAITVIHNGVVVQNHFVLKGPTEYDRWPRYMAHPEKLPIHLQEHGNAVSYRNIWIREL